MANNTNIISSRA
jgi:hypothetical protein